jgi:hypothetical protein
MSKNKVIVLAVLEAGLSQSDAARRYGVSRRWAHEPLRPYARDGEAGLQTLPRRPRASAHRTDEAVRTRIVALRGELGAAGLDTGALRLPGTWIVKDCGHVGLDHLADLEAGRSGHRGTPETAPVLPAAFRCGPA